MKTTLFIEISELTARLLVYNEVDDECHYIDITGGYGKKSIPLYIHVLEDEEILIGEDAILYDEENTSCFIESILYAKDIWAVNYIKVLMNKVHKLIPYLDFINIIVITDQKKFKSPSFLECWHKEMVHKQLEVISVEQAMAGWFYHEQYSTSVQLSASSPLKETIVYLDFKNIIISTLTNYKESHLIQIKNQQIPCDLVAIQEFYIKLFFRLHQNTSKEVTIHQMNQLYNNQKATIHKQLLVNKDVNIYSNLFFPPKKLVLPFNEFEEFKDNWYEQFCQESCISIPKELESVDKVIVSGGYDLTSFVNSFERIQLPMDDYNEYLLLQGGFSYYEAVLKGEKLIYKKSLDYAIGVFNDQEFYPLIEKGEGFKPSYELDLVITDQQKELQLFSKKDHKLKLMYTLSMNLDALIQRISLKIMLNKDKEIEEVSYELRRL